MIELDVNDIKTAQRITNALVAVARIPFPDSGLEVAASLIGVGIEILINLEIDRDGIHRIIDDILSRYPDIKVLINRELMHDVNKK